MSRVHEMAFASREEAVVGLDQLLQKGPTEKLDLGYRPYYGAPRSRIELPIPVRPIGKDRGGGLGRPRGVCELKTKGRRIAPPSPIPLFSSP